MSEGNRTIERDVMRSAQTLLFGHPDAWELPGIAGRPPRRAETARRVDPRPLLRALRSPRGLTRKPVIVGESHCH